MDMIADIAPVGFYNDITPIEFVGFLSPHIPDTTGDGWNADDIAWNEMDWAFNDGDAQ
jgi:hypothetical protein